MRTISVPRMTIAREKIRFVRFVCKYRGIKINVREGASKEWNIKTGFMFHLPESSRKNLTVGLGRVSVFRLTYIFTEGLATRFEDMV